MTSNKSSLAGIITVIILTASAFLTSCNQEKKIRGDEYIPRDKLVLVIADMHLMDGITNDMNYYRKYNPEDSIDLYSAIFEKHDVNSEKYTNTIEAYSKHPELLDAVYDEVLMRLNMLQDKVENEEIEHEKINGH